MQGFQIDIDHWRQIYLLFGAIWGLEAARVKWLRQSVLDQRHISQNLRPVWPLIYPA